VEPDTLTGCSVKRGEVVVPSQQQAEPRDAGARRSFEAFALFVFVVRCTTAAGEVVRERGGSLQ
jgi:hypothetical protein